MATKVRLTRLTILRGQCEEGGDGRSAPRCCFRQQVRWFVKSTNQWFPHHNVGALARSNDGNGPGAKGRGGALLEGASGVVVASGLLGQTLCSEHSQSKHDMQMPVFTRSQAGLAEKGRKRSRWRPLRVPQESRRGGQQHQSEPWEKPAHGPTGAVEMGLAATPRHSNKKKGLLLDLYKVCPRYVHEIYIVESDEQVWGCWSEMRNREPLKPRPLMWPKRTSWAVQYRWQWWPGACGPRVWWKQNESRTTAAAHCGAPEACHFTDCGAVQV